MHSVSTVRPVVPGGAGDAMATPYFGRSVNPTYQHRGHIMLTK